MPWLAAAVIAFVGGGLVGGAAMFLLAPGADENQAWAARVLGFADHDHGDDHHHDHGDERKYADGHPADAHDDHADHEVEEEGVLHVSEQARQSLRLSLLKVEPRDYVRSADFPAAIVTRPGRTELAVSSPIAGIVQQLHATPGVALTSGAPLIELRITDEDLIDEQGKLLAALEELDVVRKEVARLEEVTASGAVAGKRLLERQYEQQKLEAQIRVDRQSLRLHGLSEAQIEQIVATRELFRLVTIPVPRPPAGMSSSVLQVETLAISPGAHVAVGQTLATLVDHRTLYLRGAGFERDSARLTAAVEKQLPIAAIVETDNGPERIENLRIEYVENHVEHESRALRFFVALPNEVVRDETTAQGQRFIAWRFRPGQHVELEVPVERQPDVLVVPTAAVIQDGVENFVYKQEPEEPDHFARQAVQVVARDKREVVLARDGSLKPGETIAVQGAYQIHLALKNRNGGGGGEEHHHHH